MDKPKRVYWDSIDMPYQMGPQKHRLYMLDLLMKKRVLTLLDVGCGTGPIYEIINKFHADKYSFIYKGTDYSEYMIDNCKQEFPSGTFEVQDARALKEKDNSWDCVVMLHSLDHVKEYDKAIAEAARVSKKYVCIVLWRTLIPEGGGIAINDRNMMNKEPGDEPWEDTYLMQFSREALEAEFEKNGLVIEETAEGDLLNSGQSQYNFLYLLRKK